MNSEHTKSRLIAIRDRYFRPVIAFPNGHLCHCGDCSIYRPIDFYKTAACTCGFLYNLQWITPHSFILKLHPCFYNELSLEDGIILDDMDIEDESREDWSLIAEVFGEEFSKRKEGEWEKLCTKT